jgi:hypothetical protein
MTRSVSIFGATGSVGLSTLDLIRQHRSQYRVVALTANGNANAIAQLAREFDAELAVVADDAAYADLKDALAGTGIEAAAGADALVEAASLGIPAILVKSERLSGCYNPFPEEGRGIIWEEVDSPEDLAHMVPAVREIVEPMMRLHGSAWDWFELHQHMLVMHRFDPDESAQDEKCWWE